MKPPKSMRQAVRSFLGVKKKKNPKSQEDHHDQNSYNLTECRRLFGSTNDLESRQNMPRRSQSCAGERPLTLPRSLENCIEERNMKYVLDIDNESLQGMKRTVSASSRRSVEISQYMKQQESLKSHQHSKSSLNHDPFMIVSRNAIMPRTTSLQETNKHRRLDPSISFRDSRTFDIYVNEDIVSSKDKLKIHSLIEKTAPPTSRHSRRSLSLLNLSREQTDQRFQDTNFPRTSSSSTMHSAPLRTRTVSQASNASEKLLSCIDTLEHLSKRIESVHKVSNEMKQFSKVMDKMGTSTTTQDHLGKQFDIKANLDRKGRNETFSERRDVTLEHDRRNSSESTSTDSGVNLNCEFENKSNVINPPSRPRSTQDYPCLIHKHAQRRVRPSNVQKIRSAAVKNCLRSNSMSSGYSSGSGGSYPTPPSVGYYLPHHLVNNAHSQLPPSYFSGQKQSSYNHDPSYTGVNIGEDIYGYGSCGYSTSSVYDDELNQVNGWFYLPPVSHYNYHAYPAEASHYPLPTDCQSQSVCYPTPDSHYPLQNINQRSTAFNNRQLRPEFARFGALSDRFLDPTSCIPPLAAAIANTSLTADASSRITSDSSKPECENYGSFHYYNEDKTFVIPVNGDKNRRKTVRFSQMVKQRIGTEESVMKDSTSAIKGCRESFYDTPSSLEAIVTSDVSLKQNCYADTQVNSMKHTLCEQPIYEFPSGHIESSCMCSDCILARESCQLQSTANYIYY